MEAELRSAPVPWPVGKYACIVVDPPWPLRKTPMRVRPNQVGFDYPTMSLDEIAALPLEQLALTDCWIFLWTVQKYLRSAFDIMESWGGTHVCTMVWHKNGGIQPLNRPMFNCEFVLMGRIGNPQLASSADFPTCFYARRQGHSVKPQAFYDILRRVTRPPRLDLFGRREIPGFDSWGNQAPCG